MVNFCSVAICLNSSRNRPDLSFFCFPSEQSSRRVWKNFCRRSDPELRDKKTRICIAHFEASSIKKSLGGRREIIPGELPKYFNPSTNEGPVSSREKRLDVRKKRTFHEYPKPKKSRRVTQEGKDTSVTSNEAVLLDHNEGREGVKWELRFAFFRGWEMGFCALGLGFMEKKTIEKWE